MPKMKKNIDYTDLEKIPSKADLKKFRGQEYYPKTSKFLSSAKAIFFAVYIVLILITIGTMFSNSQGNTPQSFLFGGGMLLAAGVIGWFVLRYNIRKRDKKIIRLQQFAEQNGLNYTFQKDSPVYPGIIFSEGHSRYAEDIIARTEKLENFEFGNFFYTTGSGKNQSKHDWGYISISLERNLPHMVLDGSKNNNKLFGLNFSSLPVSFDKNQTLSLEGDFNKYFTLFAPKEYERDALYVFTPDLMALLVDNVAQFDAEVIDNKIYIYSSQKFDMLDQPTLKRIFSIVSVIGNNVENQTEYYSDERVGDRAMNVVAKPGQRLKQHFPVIGVVIIIIWFALTIFSIVW